MTKVERTTLVCADSQHPALAARALALTLQQCSYERAILFTDAAAVDLPTGVERVAVPRIAGIGDYSRFMLKELLRHVSTDFVQVVQWDGYVVRGEAWRPEFQQLDYIGARWWFRKPPHDVGNGGFSLRSRRLLEALQDAGVAPEAPEDDVICLKSRAMLEQRYGIRFAPGPVADAYAFEGTKPTGREFGFHRFFNLPHFAGEAELAAVVDLLPGDAVGSEVGRTFLRKLCYLGRGAEAIRYGERALQHPMPAHLRADLDAIVNAEAKRARRKARSR